MKRFYTTVDLAHDGDGWNIRLDSRPVKTPAKQPLRVPSEALASAVAEEWAAQGAEIDPRTMPLGKLATSTIDLMPTRRGDAVKEVMTIARADMLCYRAAFPAELAERQTARWQPWLDWAEGTLGHHLATTETLDPIDQPSEALRRVRAAIDLLDDWRLMGFHAAVRLTGSAILGLAIERGALDADEAIELALLEERYEMELWGIEQEQQRRHKALARDLVAACRFLRLLETG